VNTGQEFRTLSGHSGWVLGLSFTPDGQRLASASQDGTIRLWEVATGRLMLTLTDQLQVGAVAFSPDAAQLATGSSDGSVKLWPTKK
jgi:WD40 repeat protein